MVVLTYPGDLFLWVAGIFGSLILLLALITAPWRAFFVARERSLLWLGYWLLISSIWQLRIPASELMYVHLCGLTAAVFIFGSRLTIVLGALAVIGNQLLQPMDWYCLAAHFLLAVVYPVYCAAIVRFIIARIPVDNLFVFLLGGGFLGAMATTAMATLAAWLTFWLMGAWGLRVILQDNLWLFALSMFPEGFMGGAMLTTVTVLWPGLVKSYDEDRYLSQ